MSIPGAASPLFIGAAAGAVAGYQIDRSLRFNDDDSAYLNRTPSSAGNRRTFTWSGWVKRGSLGTRQNIFSGGSNATSTHHTYINFMANNTIELETYSSNAMQWKLATDAVFRDCSAWQHIVWTVDTSQSTASDRVKLYTNGTQVTSFSSATYPTQNYEGGINAAAPHAIGKYSADFGPDPFDGYLAEINFVDGQALAPTDFGEFDSNSVWQPKEFAGTYGPLVDQSQDWSSGTYSGTTPGSGYEVAKAFNNVGIPGDSFGTGKLWGYYPGSATLTLPAAITLTASSTVELYTWHNTGSSGNITFTCSNGSVAVTPVDNANIASTVVSNPYTTFGASITAITVNSSGSDWTALAGIVVDGKLLVDSDVTVTDNSFYLKFADNSSNAALGTDSSGSSNAWTVNNLTANAIDYVSSTTGTLYSGSWSEAFNGSLSGSAPYIYNTTSSVTLSTAISGVIELYVYLPGTYRNNPTVYTLSNGTTYSKSTQTAEWISFGSQSNVTSISVNAPDPGSNVFAVRVDGTILVSADPSNTDSLIDTPTNYTAASGNNGGNYCTWNPLSNHEHTASDGNLEVGTGASDGNSRINGTFAASSGKWYFEVQQKGSSPSYSTAGISKTDITEQFPGNDAGSWSYEVGQGKAKNNNTYSSTYSTLGDGDILMVAFDIDAGKLWFGKNGTFFNSGDPANGTNAIYTNLGSGSFRPCARPYGSGNSFVLNAGQRSFSYAPPTGFLSLCTTNLATPTIADGSTAFDALLYTGDGQSSKAVTGYGFSPDFLWIKERSSTSGHGLWNTVVGSSKYLSAESSAAEYTTTTELSSIDSAGFTVGSSGMTNQSSQTYVAWAWDAGTSTVSNTDGSITSSVRANPSAGFSIVSYNGDNNAGDTVGHGLSAKPGWILIKNRDDAFTWYVYHSTSGGTKYLRLDTSNAETTGSGAFNNTEPTSSVFSLGQDNAVNDGNKDYIAYCWAPVNQYSAFGSYQGNSSADGTFVYTGMRPRWLMVKSSSNSGEHWLILDTKRDTHNVADATVYANLDNAEAEAGVLGIDILSNGFKCRGTNAGINASGYTYVYFAFAFHPFKTARAR